MTSVHNLICLNSLYIVCTLNDLKVGTWLDLRP